MSTRTDEARSEFQAAISKLVVLSSGTSFKPDAFAGLCGPGVYLLIQAGRAVYVGMASNLLRRLSSKHHKRYVISECDEILTYQCATVEDAVRLEAILITTLRPILNKSGKKRKLTYELLKIA